MAVQKSKNTKRFFKNINNLYKKKLILKSKTYSFSKHSFKWQDYFKYTWF